MSVMYCEKHGRHVDLDWGDCPECEEELAEKEEEEDV